jgi:hypothetical protein
MKPLRWLTVSLSLATAEAPTALSLHGNDNLAINSSRLSWFRIRIGLFIPSLLCQPIRNAICASRNSRSNWARDSRSALARSARSFRAFRIRDSRVKFIFSFRLTLLKKSSGSFPTGALGVSWTDRHSGSLLLRICIKHSVLEHPTFCDLSCISDVDSALEHPTFCDLSYIGDIDSALEMGWKSCLHRWSSVMVWTVDPSPIIRLLHCLWLRSFVPSCSSCPSNVFPVQSVCSVVVLLLSI